MSGDDPADEGTWLDDMPRPVPRRPLVDELAARAAAEARDAFADGVLGRVRRGTVLGVQR